MRIMRVDDILSEKWKKSHTVPKEERGKHSNKSVSELRNQLKKAKERGDTDLVRELNFAIRANTGWGKVKESHGEMANLDLFFEEWYNIGMTPDGLDSLTEKDIVEIMIEAKKPSAGMSKKEKSEVASRARRGEDIGKKGKRFKEVAQKAAKKYGSKEAGERVAAAAMWKQQAKK